MKILLVGSDRVWAIENFYHKYLNELGVQTQFFLAQSIFFDYYQRSIKNKIVFKLGLSGIYRKINAEFKRQVEHTRPTIIFIFKGMEIHPSSLVWAKKKGVKLVSYNPDSPFIFTGKGSGNKNVTQSIALYDLHLTYDSIILRQIKNGYGLPAAILPFGFNLSEHLYNECLMQDEIITSCFLGNPDIYRAEFINGIAEAGICIDVFGNDWKNFVRHPNITISEAVYGDDFWKTLHRYRVQLNLMRPHNPESHNMRTFEVPGVGGILLAPDTGDHRAFFEPGTEIFLYNDLESGIKQLKHILSLSKADANTIRRNARSKSLKAGFTYKDRAAQALDAMRGLLAS